MSYLMRCLFCLCMGVLSAQDACQSASSFTYVRELVPQIFTSQFQQLLESGEYREAIHKINEEIATKQESEKAPLFVLLATVYIRDQKEEEAFKSFLQALLLCPQKESLQINADDLGIYNQLLPLYIEQSKYPASQAAKELEAKLAPILSNHPEYVEVRFLYAAAKANLQQYEEFFFHFFKAYKEDSASFLAYRTLAVLNLKLYEKARYLEEKENFRKAMQEYGRKALEKNVKDVQMYKLLVLFSKPELKKETLCYAVLAIVDNNVQIPRSDIPFYVNELVAFNEHDLALNLLDTEEKLYQYSRIIDEMRKAVCDDKDRSSRK